MDAYTYSFLVCIANGVCSICTYVFACYEVTLIVYFCVLLFVRCAVNATAGGLGTATNAMDGFLSSVSGGMDCLPSYVEVLAAYFSIYVHPQYCICKYVRMYVYV